MRSALRFLVPVIMAGTIGTIVVNQLRQVRLQTPLPTNDPSAPQGARAPGPSAEASFAALADPAGRVAALAGHPFAPKTAFAFGGRTVPRFAGEEWTPDAARLNHAVDCVNASAAKVHRSFAQYAAWVRDLDVGPRGNETDVEGLAPLVPVEACASDALARVGEPPHEAVGRTVTAYADALARLVPMAEAARVYYAGDGPSHDAFARGKTMHAPLMVAFVATSNAEADLRRALSDTRVVTPAPPFSPAGAMLTRRDSLLADADAFVAEDETVDAAPSALEARLKTLIASVDDFSAKGAWVTQLEEPQTEWHHAFLIPVRRFVTAARERIDARVAEKSGHAPPARVTDPRLVRGTHAYVLERYAELVDRGADARSSFVAPADQR